ncbi:glycosyltransferase [Janthinobacterium fluminis]|uniref:Glycosyltransferase n=1 Tax=Janthinobacterium fluminis TaxID=2987524 RepID=A0ABT5JWR5_9BURK|nr:glycosyltransferase [Janthinobacterium fluminis]MDC8756855.1 glycosyltransferase [Janthinobacterium fluminis]
MRVGILSYPMLFQRDGGLQIQVRETVAALNRLEPAPPCHLQVELVDPTRDRLDNYDLIHVFSAINGNYRIVELASELGLPVVLSPLLSPGWGRSSGILARLAERLAGKLTAWNVQTSYAQSKRALQLADLVIALGDAERRAIMAGFQIDPRKIEVFPNGINPQFFCASGDLFRNTTGIHAPFVLMVGAISPYKNQLGLAQALASLALPIVMIGAAKRQDQSYLQKVLRLPRVTWLGALAHADPLLASAYSAAAVVALPSQGEVFPLAVLEALASGTPVVMTTHSALELPGADFALKKVRWDDAAAQRRAIAALLGVRPDRQAVRALVSHFTWERVAGQIAGCYFRLGGREGLRRVV